MIIKGMRGCFCLNHITSKSKKAMMTFFNVISIILWVLAGLGFLAFLGEKAPVFGVLVVICGSGAVLFGYVRDKLAIQPKGATNNVNGSSIKKFQVGNKVKLISGGPVMTVDGYASFSKSKVVCKWFDNNQSHKDSFDESTLEIE